MQDIAQKAWVVAVNMGYGHQRTAFPLRHLAGSRKVVNANNYPGIPARDKWIWLLMQRAYEAISRFKTLPLLGEAVFALYDRLQAIPRFFPKRDLSRPPLSLKWTFFLFRRGWGRHLMSQLEAGTPALPLVTTFFIPAFMAEHFNYPGEIFCVVCDTDISRAWASLRPQESRIKYFAPTNRVVERLKLYGVKPENIFFTGYPLPVENIGSKELELLKTDLKQRLANLDPQGTYLRKYRQLIENYLGQQENVSLRPLTIMFSVGGAGAQRGIGIKAVKGLRGQLKNGQVKIILVAGARRKVERYFISQIKRLGLEDRLNLPHKSGVSLSMQDKNIEIIFARDVEGYFKRFNRALRTTDILWTKPSELSFYAALGVPIIVAPPIGSQEKFNARWLLKSGFGISQENPRYVESWLFDWIESGYLAECAMQGFIEGEKLGVFKIEEIISKSGHA